MALSAWGFDGLHGIRRSARFSYRLLSSNKIDILARDFELTEPLRQRAESKFSKVLDKLASPGIISTHLVLRVHKNDAEEVHSSMTKPASQIAEVTVKFKGGQVFHTQERTEDMYSSIDILSHKLALKLKRHKDKVQSKRKNEKIGGNVAEDEEAMEPFNDEELLLDLNKEYKNKYLSSIEPPREMDVAAVKRKVFAMPPITLDEAIASLEYVDHPFFVFRNKDSGEVNVIYKKEDGGVGHIMPEK